MNHNCRDLALVLVLSMLAGCASTQGAAHKDFEAVAERTYKGVPYEQMYTLALRTIHDMHLTKETISKDETDAFLVFQVMETDYSEMAMDLRPDPGDSQSTQVTMFAHTRDDRTAAIHILDNLQEQIALDRDPLHQKPH